MTLSQVKASWSEYPKGLELDDDDDDNAEHEAPKSTSITATTPATGPPAIDRLSGTSTPASTSTSTSTSSTSTSLSTNTALTTPDPTFTPIGVGHRTNQRPTITDSPLFVTWNTISPRSGNRSLRGCIGTFESMELSEGIASYALTSALHDVRFNPISVAELPSLEVSVTLLTDFESAKDAMDWELGVHGLRISFYYHHRKYGACYLPDVAPEQGWDKEETVKYFLQAYSPPDNLSTLRYPSSTKSRVDSHSTAFLAFVDNNMDLEHSREFQASSLDDTRSWKVEADVKVHPEEAGLPLDIGPYTPIPGTFSYMPKRIATSTHVNVNPRKRHTLTEQSDSPMPVKSVTSYSTLSSAESPNFIKSSLLSNSDFLLDTMDPPGASAKRLKQNPATFQCTICSKRYTGAVDLHCHLAAHYRERSYDCWVCGKGFARPDIRNCHKVLHFREKKFVCKGEQNCQGCGRRLESLDILARHLRSEEGRVCTNRLIDEQSIKRQDWSDILQDNVDLVNELESFDTFSSESSCDTFSSLPSDEFDLEKGCIINERKQATQLSTDYSDVRMSASIAIDKGAPAKDSLDIPEMQPDVGQVNFYITRTDPDSSDKRQYMDGIIQAQSEESEQSTSISSQADGGRIPDAELARQDKTRESGHDQLPQFDATKVGKPLEDYSAEISDSDVNNIDRDADTIKRKENDLGVYPKDCISKESHYTQLSPARNFSSTIAGTLGKASPYSPQSQDSESDSYFEVETELGLDDCESVLSPSPSIFNLSEVWAPKQTLIVDVLHTFWDIYNEDSSAIISRCVALMAKEATNRTTSGTGSSSSRSTSSTSASSTTLTSSNILSSSGAKRKLSEDITQSNGSGGKSPEPNQGVRPTAKDQLASRVALWDRLRQSPASKNIYIEGTWPQFNALEKRLRSRKKASVDQTDEDRWRDIYRLLFPGVPEGEVPSPFYESVQDDVAQAPESLEISVEEFMRQEVPQIFTSRLQNEVDNMDLEESGLLDDPARLRQTFISRMTSLINEAQETAVEAYRQKLSENSLPLKQPMTPRCSSGSESCPALSQESSRASQPSYEPKPSPPPEYQLPSSSQDFQSVNHVASELDHYAVHDCLMTPMAQKADNTSQSTVFDSNLPESLLQFNKESEHCNAGREQKFDGEWSLAAHNFQQEYIPNNPYSEWVMPDDSEFTAATWMNNNSP
ncbi:hypothetical protein B7463_g141, partial [Scytalidium lignicola]